MKMSNEVKVGILTSIVILIFALIILFAGEIKFKEEGYHIKVKFNFIGDLKKGAPVIFAGGIRVGKVEDIRPLKDGVEVVLFLKKDFKIKEENEIMIYTQGLLGDKYIEINGYNGPGRYLKDGEVVKGVDPVSLDAMTVKLTKILKGVFGPTLTDEEVKKSFANLFNNSGEFVYNLNMLISENRPNLYSMIKNMKYTTSAIDENLTSVLKEIKDLSKSLGKISKENQKSISITIKNLEKTSKRLNTTVKELEETSKNLNHISRTIKKRKGTVGKLIYEDEIYRNLDITLKNLAIFSEKIRKNPRTLLFGR